MHDLLEAGPPSGHLSMQAAWSARARMRAGQQAHSAWQDERAAEDERFRREVTIKHTVVVDEWECTVQGRLDGLSWEGEHVVVEEVKSTALPGDRLAGLSLDDVPGYVRQLQLYLWFLAAEGRDPIGRLVLIGLADGFRRVMHVPFDPDLGRWLRSQLSWIVGERQRRMAWLHQRRGAVVPFAHESFRPGQERLSEEVSEALHSNRHLLLSAPTGYGKTAAVLYGAIQVAWATDRRIFFATARTTQQRMAEEALLAMADRGLPLRAVSIRAREKLCLNDVVACRPDACRFARGYHDKVREGGLTERAWHGHARLSPDEVLTIAEPAEACPFALTLDLARGADVVVGDYNYVFDPAVRLAEIGENPDEWIVIADEAHNLPERAMGYSSPTVELSLVQQALDALDSDPRYGGVADVAARIAAWLRDGAGLALEHGQRDRISGWRELSMPLDDALSRRELRQLAEDVDAVALDYVLLKHERPLFLPGEPDPWLESARGVLRLRSALDRAGEETVAIWRAKPGRRRRGRSKPAQLTMLGPAGDSTPPDVEVALSLLCRDPSGLLSPLFLSLAGSVQMSATLSPPEFFQQMSGLPHDKTVVADFPSPFPPEHRRVLVLPQVSTEYKHRERDRAETAALVSRVVAAVPGNVAVFCSSFTLRDDLLPHMDLGGRPVLMQERRMDEAARQGLLDTLQRAEGHVLLGVLGGIFAEGVDLPGDALLAAVVVGPSLPMANLERRLLQQWFQDRYQEGFRYAWLVPGMARVVQAAGRVVRTPEDRGAVVLVGQRFLRRQYQDFFPRDWEALRSKDPVADLAGLWDGGER